MMPPPMMTARAADGTDVIDSSELLQAVVRALETGEIVVGIRDIVKIECRMMLCHHAPHGLTQQRGALHGLIAAPQLRRQRLFEIGLEQPFLVGLGNLVVRAEVAEIEERAVEARVVPIDEPQALPVVDEVARQQVIVAEHDIDRSGHRLEAGTDAKQSRQLRNHATPAVGQSLRVIAEDLEHPEDQCRSAEMAGHVAVATLQQRQDAPQIGRLAYVAGCEGLAVDILENDGAGFVVEDRWRQAGGGGGAAGRQLVKAQNSMHEDVVTDAHEMTPAAIGHDEVRVGDAAFQRLRRNRAGPAGERGCPGAWIDALHDDHASPNRSFTRRLQALMSRSAAMPMKAAHKPATMPRPGSAFDRAVNIS